MTFERPWLLFVLILPVLWAAWNWRASRRRGALILKTLTFCSIIAALAAPQLTVFEEKVAVAVLVDTSASTSDEDLEHASAAASAIERARGRNTVEILPFAQTTRPRSEEERKEGKLRYTPGEAGRATDLEAAVREGIASLPAGRVARVVLISDGNENRGSMARAAWQARQLGVPVDTIALAGRPRPLLHLDAVTLPSQAFTGERFPIDVMISSPKRANAKVEISAEGKVLGTSAVSLQPGTNQVRVQASLTTTGAVDLGGRISSPELGEVRFAQAVALQRPRLLMVSDDPPGTGMHLLKTLEAAEFQVEQVRAVPARELDRYQLIVLNNQNLEALPPARKAALETFAKQGGGLIVIGGERNVYVEKKGPEDPLERILPAKLAPPRTPEGTCVVLILDKSSSMEGRKVELARLAAIGVVENLRPIDLVGVLMFDNSFHWAVPIRRAEEKNLIKRVIAGIMPDGGTQIAPALQEGYRRILPVNAIYKHVVLLTDGISEEGDSMAMAREAASRQVTISTVGLGQDVNRTFLEKVATFAKGKSYFLTDPSGLEQILLRDVMEHTGSTAVEKAIRAGVARKAEILEHVDMESAPPLDGYVRFISKPTADVILTAERNDPLFVRWQYGLGRTAIFASDAKSRWARRWVAWEGYDRFWANVLRDLLPHAQAGEAKLNYDSASDELVVEYRLAGGIPEPDTIPDIFAFGPQGFQKPVRMEKATQGVYRGRVRIENRLGLFRVRPAVESQVFPEIGLLRQQAELNEFGSNEALLKQIAEFTGGRFQPSPDQVFNAAGRSVPSTLRLWPALLALALLLNVIELVARKWRGIMESRRTAVATA
ncbi:MAG TPA: VWA domain-containing protein [Bryobacteraceae bacterium]|nr:VWA domain-containing protein [Bryobacteraceae bacterium]